MEIPRHIGGEDNAAYDREAGRRHAREERWRRVRSLRLKNWFFSILWLLVTLILFGVLFGVSEVALHFLVQLLPRLNSQDAAVYAIATQVALWIMFMAAAVYLINSPRGDACIRRWGPRGVWAWDPMQKVRFHARYCADRNRATAAVFVVSCALEVVYAWGNLNKPLPSERLSVIVITGPLVSIAFLVTLCFSFTCFGERLTFGIGAAASVLQLVSKVVPALAATYVTAFRTASLLLWTSAVLASLALLKSALRAPPPSTPHL